MKNRRLQENVIRNAFCFGDAKCNRALILAERDPELDPKVRELIELIRLETTGPKISEDFPEHKTSRKPSLDAIEKNRCS